MSHRSPKYRSHNPTTKRLDRGRGRNKLIPTQLNNVPMINKRPQYTLNPPPKSINREIPPTRARSSYEYRKENNHISNNLPTKKDTQAQPFQSINQVINIPPKSLQRPTPHWEYDPTTESPNQIKIKSVPKHRNEVIEIQTNLPSK